MYLIDVATLQLVYFDDETKVPGGYAILSHRWEKEEVSYKDISKPKRRQTTQKLKGFYKIKWTCRTAAQDGLKYAWVDTCCINKESSAELQEAINSMFRWYGSAKVCYAYLSDVSNKYEFMRSEWFTRGWTLQELLAPSKLVFYDSVWKPIGNRKHFAQIISNATSITRQLLIDGWTAIKDRPCAAVILHWASDRVTSRVEDAAYSLLGFFNINMPLLYGERDKAFQRLQYEILRSMNDQSLFLWSSIGKTLESKRGKGYQTSPLLAPSPSMFKLHPSLWPDQLKPRDLSVWTVWRAVNCGSEQVISADLQLRCLGPRLYSALLNTGIVPGRDTKRLLCMVLKRVDRKSPFREHSADERYVRVQSRSSPPYAVKGPDECWAMVLCNQKGKEVDFRLTKENLWRPKNTQILATSPVVDPFIVACPSVHVAPKLVVSITSSCLSNDWIRVEREWQSYGSVLELSSGLSTSYPTLIGFLPRKNIRTAWSKPETHDSSLYIHSVGIGLDKHVCPMVIIAGCAKSRWLDFAANFGTQNGALDRYMAGSFKSWSLESHKVDEIPEPLSKNLVYRDQSKVVVYGERVSYRLIEDWGTVVKASFDVLANATCSARVSYPVTNKDGCGRGQESLKIEFKCREDKEGWRYAIQLEHSFR